MFYLIKLSCSTPKTDFMSFLWNELICHKLALKFNTVFFIYIFKCGSIKLEIFFFGYVKNVQISELTLHFVILRVSKMLNLDKL